MGEDSDHRDLYLLQAAGLALSIDLIDVGFDPIAITVISIRS